MGKANGIKGQGGEREIIALFAENLGVKLERNLEQCRNGGPDLKGMEGWSIEVKRAADDKSKLHQWWQQTLNQTQPNERPVLFYRYDRCQWIAVMALRDLHPGCENAPRYLHVEMSFQSFAMVARESIKSIEESNLLHGEGEGG